MERVEHTSGLLCGDGKRNRDFDNSDNVSGDNTVVLFPAAFQQVHSEYQQSQQF